MSAKANSIRPCDSVVSTSLENEGVLVDLDSKRYYSLNETAMMIWQCLEKGVDTSAIIGKMTSIYDVTTEHASESLNHLLQEFRSRDLVR